VSLHPTSPAPSEARQTIRAIRFCAYTPTHAPISRLPPRPTGRSHCALTGFHTARNPNGVTRLAVRGLCHRQRPAAAPANPPHHEQAAGEGGVEGLEVEAQLVEHGAQDGLWLPETGGGGDQGEKQSSKRGGCGSGRARFWRGLTSIPTPYLLPTPTPSGMEAWGVGRWKSTSSRRGLPCRPTQTPGLSARRLPPPPPPPLLLSAHHVRPSCACADETRPSLGATPRSGGWKDRMVTRRP
jgi:hypothetical protein